MIRPGGTRLLAVGLVGVLALACAKKLDRNKLDHSLTQGRAFLLANQKPAGNFTYQYDFVAGKEIQGLSPVRQAGALWGLALIHLDDPTMETKQALETGFDYFLEKHGKVSEDGRRWVVYPGARQGSTGTVALTTLALIEYLRAGFEIADREHYEHRLDELLSFLLSLRMPNGHFHSNFDYQTGRGLNRTSPYFDGETLLALTKAARFLGYENEFKSKILDSAEAMYETYGTEARKREPDSKQTKGFYQWGSMSFFHIHKAGWDPDDEWAKRTIELAYWMIDTHRTLARTRNTAYAHEGMISAWELARETGDEAAVKKIGRVVDKGLYKLTSWQVDGPVPNRYLRAHPTDDELAVGGVMNGKNDPVLRIDVTQHQMHAVLLAREYIYEGDTQ